MPRPRPLRTKEEIAKVPPEKSVTLDLSPEEEVIDGENPFEVEEPQKTPPGTRQPKKADLVSGAPDGGEAAEDVTDLKRQLDDMRKAQEESERRIQREVQARQEAERLVQEREREASSSRARAEDAEYDAILNAIGAAEAEAEKAQQDMALASEAADHKAIADANRRLARAESRLAQLNDGKVAIEQQKTAEAARAKSERENPPERVTKTPTVEEYVDQLPNLLQSQRDWLKAHPDSITNPRMNTRLQGAHFEAEDKGLRPGTKGYFEYLEERLGYAAAPEPEEEDDVKTPVSAPPSRTATNPSTGRPSNNRITLTPEQREMARLSGIDELTYARQLQRLNELKASGVIN